MRVADASIFPQLICGNINAATIMVGEKASDLILGKQEEEPIKCSKMKIGTDRESWLSNSSKWTGTLCIGLF